MCVTTDRILFYESIEIKEKIPEKEFYFDLVRDIKDSVTGILGLPLTDEIIKLGF